MTPALDANRPASEQRTLALHHVEHVMGTVVTIDIYTDPGTSAYGITERVEKARSILRHADEAFSTWKKDSPISLLRRGEISLAQAPPDVAEVLEYCKTARDRSGGWFDPWAMPGGVDPTGYVKGWAAQRALNVLVAPGITGAIVNAAGDIASFGGLSESSPFRFGIVDPFDRTRLACLVELVGALATSGTYERGEHLIDPHTGEARVLVASASVTGPDLGLADALATGVAVAGELGLPAIEALDGYEALTIAFDGTKQWTTSFPLAKLLPPQ